jgi:uncharacterized protein with HEPN domain
MARRVDVVLDEILLAISGIEDAVAGYSVESFAENWLLQRGVERGLEIISEAVRHLPDDLLAQESSITWQDIRSIGNLIRHEYHRVEPAIVWSVVVDDLPPLRDAIERLRDTITS